MSFVRKYLKERKWAIWIAVICMAILVSVWLLYGINLSVILYTAVLCFVTVAFFTAIDMISQYRKYREMTKLASLPANLHTVLENYNGMEDICYREIIENLSNENKKILLMQNETEADMTQYYTTWIHQIKTPIASMKLKLQSEDSPLSRELEQELFRIEQYVEMVLAYLRLGSDNTDYIFKKIDLDTVIKQSIRKLSGQFILKGLGLDYRPVNTTVISDSKWLGLVIEQILTNGVKYTSSGKISIYMEDDKVLCIRDMGIGIAPEDLPRIFENGYTGYNGHNNSQSSGIGLYLCKRICDNLGHKITVESKLDEGTVFKLHLNKKDIVVE